MVKVGRRFLATVAMVAVMLAVWSGAAVALDAPKWVAAIHIEAQNAVGLRWLPTPGATGYKVLRSTTAGSGYEEIAAPATPQHFDTAVAVGNTYFYVLQAVAGAEVSPNSEEKSVPLVAKQAVKPKPPTWEKLAVDQAAKAISLKWSAVPGAVAYNIYRRESFKPAGKEQLIGSVQSADPYLDKAGLKKGIEYVYNVSVLDGSFQESDKSNTQKIKFAIRERKARAKKETKVVKTRKTVPVKIFEYSYGEDEDPTLDVQPTTVAWYDDEIYVYFQLKGKIQVFDDEDFSLVREFGVDEETEDGKQFPRSVGHMAFDPDGNLWMSDLLKARIAKFDTNGGYKGEVATDNGVDPNNEMDTIGVRVNRFAFDPDGMLYFSDFANHVVRLYDEDGNLVNRIGGRKVFAIPANIHITKDGRLVVLEAIGSRVQVFDKDLNNIAMFGSAGSREGQFGRPSGMAVDDDKDLVYIADFINHVVHVYNLKGEIQGTIKYYDSISEEKRRFNQPSNLAISDDKVLYMVEYGMKKIMAFKDGE